MGLTQEALARISGLSRSTINAVEAQSIGNLSIAKAEGLLESLGLSMTVSAPSPHPPASKPPRARTALQRAAATASVSYKLAMNARQLATVLTSGKAPNHLRPHVRALLDEAPMSLLAKVVQELSEKNGVPPSEVWATMRALARELDCYRAFWW
jgi:transcriptional regulator with XRE-family HTH domain